VARRFRVGVATVQLWGQRARHQRLDRVDWTDRPPIPRTIRRTDTTLEDLVLTVRRERKETSALGEFGAAAIQRALRQRGIPVVPSLRTLGRILARRGALDARQRVRRRPPPLGWSLPEVAACRAEVDRVDIVEGLVIKGGPQVEVRNVISLHGGLVASWPRPAITAKVVTEARLEHWRAWGLPTYAQFDNDTRFQGPQQHPDALGRVIRLCLSWEIVPVFAPPRETGFQAALASDHGRWQAKVWQRFQHERWQALEAQSGSDVAAYHGRAAARIEGAPRRRPFPTPWRRHLRAPVQGCRIDLRRTTAQGEVTVRGHRFIVDATWPHRLVRAEVDLDGGVIRFYALRRREPTVQPLLHTIPYQLPARRFRE
jgi:glycosyltransferase A (GT-A) superfamily protein (DUF2064 family)